MSNNQKVFNGFGAHTTSDFLHTIGLHPLMPCYLICKDDALYTHFKFCIVKYLQTWVSAAYMKAASGQANSANPFAYNYTAGKNYQSIYVEVYRKEQVRMDLGDWVKLWKKGYFDRNHIIGQCIYIIFSYLRSDNIAKENHRDYKTACC